MENKELELRLMNTEQALALALKKIEELSQKQEKGKMEKPPLKDFIDAEVYKDLFSFATNDVINGRTKHNNFSALYKRVEVVAGLRFHKEGNNSFSPFPLLELKCSEYERFGKLMSDVCRLIYDFKHGEAVANGKE